MNKKLKKRIRRVGVGAFFYVSAVLFQRFFPQFPWYVYLAAFLISYVIIGGGVVKNAIGNIGRGQVFDENFLMTIATLGAFFVGDYPEAVAVMLFYQVGECFQSYAVNRSRKSIAGLMDIRPDYANIMQNGVWEKVDPDQVAPGETILVRPGEKIPLDGIVEKGTSLLDTMALTGESIPRDVQPGDNVISGCVNENGLLEIKVTRPFGQSTVARILDLVENATSKKAQAENFITKFARYYTPVVVFCALALAFFPPLLMGGDWKEWIYRALSFLVISCPCALVISIPLSFFGGLGGASREGILIKGSNYLEALASAEIVVMDKTGTLTKGNFAVSKIVSAPYTRENNIDLLMLAACAESYSNHPISRSIVDYYEKERGKKALPESSQVKEIPGQGVIVKREGKELLAGNEKLMRENHIAFEAAEDKGTIVYIGQDGQYLGYILIEDEVKADAKQAIREMKRAGVRKVVMLTGDHADVARKVAEQLGIDDYRAELLPGDKVDEVEKLFAQKSSRGKLVFVGDGVNDAPVLARADIGIAMGGLGSDAAIEAADVVIMTDEPSRIAKAMRISARTLGIVRQNIVFAIGVKIFVLILAAIGLASMWAAVFADVGVAVIAILNAMRAMKGNSDFAHS